MTKRAFLAGLILAVGCDLPTGTSGPLPTISLSAAALSFTGVLGGAAPASQNITISNTGGGTLSWSALANQPWVSVSPTGGPGTSLTVSISTTGLAAGTHNAAIAISARSATNSPQIVNITLTLEPPPTISLSTASLNFTGVTGGAAPASQTVTISNSGGSTLSWSAVANQPWVSVSPTSGTGTTLTVSVTTTGLTSGTHTAAIAISSGAATNSPQSVSITLTLGPPPTISLSAASLNFTGVTGGAAPASQNITISNTGGSTLVWSASANQAWVGIAPTSGSGTTLTVSINTTGLATGTHNAAIAISSGTATNSPQSVNITLTLEPPPTISVSATTMTFAGIAGGASPATQELTITNTGGGALVWAASDDQSWLSLSAAGGTAPSGVTVTANSAGLAVGSYTGIITIIAAGATNSPRTVTVTLNVTADLSGVWVGTTSQDSTVRITVVENAVTQIYFGFRFPACGVTGATTTNFTIPFSVAAGTINRTVSGSPISWTIGGTFSGGTTASGTLSVSWNLSGCSSTVNLTWTAVKT